MLSSRQILSKSSEAKGQIHDFFNAKIPFLLEPRYSCMPFLMKNTCNRQVFPSICAVHVFLLNYSANTAPVPPWISWKTTTADAYLELLISLQLLTECHTLHYIFLARRNTPHWWFACRYSDHNRSHISVPPIIHRSIFVSVHAEPLNGEQLNGEQLKGRRLIWNHLHVTLFS